MPSGDTSILSQAIKDLARRMRRLEANGGAGILGGAITATDTTPPTVPSGLTALAITQTSLILTWAPSTDSVGVGQYRVYRNAVQVGSSSLPSFSDSGLAPSTSYDYTVDAVDVVGNASVQSAVLTVTTLTAPADTTPPSTPTGLATTAVGTTSVSLTWNPSTDDTGVNHYSVYRNGTPVGAPTGTSFIDSAVLPATAYTYTVDAVDLAGNHSGQSTALIVNTNSLPTVNTWYVSPAGLSTNDGSQGSPWSLSFALNGGAGGKILAGHTVYLRGGTYVITGAAQIVTSLVGTALSRITVTAFPGELPSFKSPDGTGHDLMEIRTVSYTDFLGIEHSINTYTRTTQIGGGGLARLVYENPAYTQYNNRWYGCWFHDAPGIAFRSPATSDATEINGCFFYYNGSNAAIDWNVWMQSASGHAKKIKDSVFLHSAADMISLYSADSSGLSGITLDGVAMIGPGDLYANAGRGAFAAGVSQAVTNMVFNANTFDQPYLAADGDSAALQLGHIGTTSGGNTTFTVSVAAGADDGRYGSDGTTFNTGGTAMQIGWINPNRMSGWTRFAGVTVPNGASIVSAKISVMAAVSRSAGVAFMKLRGDKSSVNPAAPSTNADVTGRARTTANVPWNPPALTAATSYDTPDITAIVQEIVNQGSWASGNAMDILWDEDGGLSVNDVEFDTFESTGTKPLLTIVYVHATSGSYSASIAAGGDDGRFGNDGTTFNTGGTVFQVGKVSTVTMSGWTRFTGVTIPPGATITGATLTVMAGTTRSAGVASLNIKGDKSAVNPTAPSSVTDATGRARTTAAVAWTPGALTSGVSASPPDIATVIQEIINQGTWASGNAITLFWDATGTPTNDVEFDTFESTGTKPAIAITYTTGTTVTGDAGVSGFSGADNYLLGDRLDLGGSGYSGVTFSGNTVIYSGSNSTGTEATFPTNTYLHAYPTTGIHIWSRAFDWNPKRANIIIKNWGGATSVTVSATDLAGLDIASGDNYELHNCENYFSDVLTGQFNGSSITIDLTTRTQATPGGAVAVPASFTPVTMVFHIIALGNGGGGGTPPPTGDTTAPSVPTGLGATAVSSSQINLVWSASTDNVAVTGYSIYQGGTKIGTTSGTTYNVTGLGASTAYTFTVDAFDAAGNHSAQSTSASATTAAAPPPPTGSANWYIGTSGSSSNSGSRSSPFSLTYGLSGAGGSIGAGDVIYLLAGTYTTTSGYKLGCSGTSGHPITFQAEPGAHVTLNGSGTGIFTFEIDTASYVNFIDIEFMGSGYSRPTNVLGTGAYETNLIMSSSTSYTQTQVKFYGCLFHDSIGMGVKSWEQTRTGVEFNGCVNYYNGHDQQHDHGWYCHNNDSYPKVFRDCITHNNASYNFHGYDDGSRPVNNFNHIGSVWFNPNTLYGGNGKNNMLIGNNGSDTQDPKIQNCFFYGLTQGPNLKVGYNSSYNVTGAVITNNYSVGRTWILDNAFSSPTITGNTLYTNQSTSSTTASRLSGSGNSINSIPSSGTDIFVRTYNWDAKRANIIIFNYGSSASVTVTNAMLTGAGVTISSGKTYELHNAENFFGDVLTGTYNGTSISIPMTGRSMATPQGSAPKPPSAFPKFGCFVLKVTS